MTQFHRQLNKACSDARYVLKHVSSDGNLPEVGATVRVKFEGRYEEVQEVCTSLLRSFARELIVH